MITTARMLLRDLITRLAQSDAKELYVDIEEPEQDVFVIPMAAVLGLPDATGLLDRIHQDSGILQAGPVLEYHQALGITGDATSPLFGSSAEIWEMRSVSLTSDAGATYSVIDTATIVSPGVAIGAGASGELLSVPLPFAGNAVLSVDNGLVADVWNVKAVRLK